MSVFSYSKKEITVHKQCFWIIASILVISPLMFLWPGLASAQTVIALDDQLKQYWVLENIVAPKYPRAALKRGKMGCVSVGYIIQTDGTTSDHKILAFYPSDIFDKSAMKAAQQLTYSPSVQNPNRIPALTQNVFTFFVFDDTRGDGGDGDDKKKLLDDMCSNAGRKVLDGAAGTTANE